MEQKHSFQFDESHGCFQNFENRLMCTAHELNLRGGRRSTEQCAAIYHAGIFFLDTCHGATKRLVDFPALPLFCSSFGERFR